MNNPSYQQTLDYLYEQLPMFAKLGKDAVKKDLTNIRKLCNAMDNPQQQFKVIHIAGTNGKGSTSHMLSAALQLAGYKTGLYTSPHLVDFRERIRINGKPVSEAWVVCFVEKYKKLIEEIEPSFFEITVAMAFEAFAENKVDIAVIETGLGGRLDSTNIVEPLLSIITNISYDHKDMLGNTLGEIAFEKAGIIKSGIPALIGEQHPETERVFFEQAHKKQSTLYYAEALWDLVKVKRDARYQYYKAVHKARREIYDLRTDLRGSYQSHNIKTVLAAAELLEAGPGLHIPLDVCLQAMSMVKQLTGLHGRWDMLSESPLIIADVAHNTAGIKEVMQQLEELQAAKKYIVVGFVKDKEVSEALSLFPLDAYYYFCNAQLPRALPAAELKIKAEKWGLHGEAYNTVTDAVNAARAAMHDNDVLLITGSFFVVGEAMQMNELAVSPLAQ